MLFNGKGIFSKQQTLNFTDTYIRRRIILYIVRLQEDHNETEFGDAQNFL